MLRKGAAFVACAGLALGSVPMDASAQVAVELSLPASPLPADLAPSPLPLSESPMAVPLSPLPASPLDALNGDARLFLPQNNPGVPITSERGVPVLRGLGAASSSLPPNPEERRSRANRLFDGSALPGKAADDGDDIPVISRHDAHRVQVKLDVTLVPGKMNEYRIGTYFFVPHALGITPQTYKKDDFYSHIQRRIRFKTPATSLAEILDKTNETSPLTRFSTTLAKLLAGDKSATLPATAYTEIRLLGKIASVALRNQAGALAAFAAAAKPDIPTLSAGANRLAADSIRLIGEVRALKSASAAAPEKVRETAAFLDEFLSLSVAEHLVTLLDAIRRKPELASALALEDARLAGLIKSEDAARAAAGYPSIVDKATGSEAMFYRRAVLTNFFSSVLEFENKTSAWKGAFEVLFSLSAGLSALTVLIVMQVARGHLASHVIALILVGMGAEILKDRLKEAIKIWTTRRWTRRFSDAVTAIRDPSTGKVVGKVRESFGFVPRFALPPEVLKIRQADPLAAVGEDGKPEDVLHYLREVTIDPRAIDKYHTRRRNLDDLMLVNLLPFLDNTDDKAVEFTTLDPETGKLETLSGTRVHHVNIVTRYDVSRPKEAAATRYERSRIVMDREGIKRVEAVPLPAK
jgi:hypothetical protein